MKMMIRINFLFFLLSASVFAEAPYSSFDIYTEDWRPYQFIDHGEKKGVAVELLELILSDAGSDQTRQDFQFVPWARGMSHLRNNKNSMLFLTTRTTERDQQFKWVGPVFQNTTSLFAKKTSQIVINSTNDLGRYTIGTVIDDVGEAYLKKLNIPDLKLSGNVASINNLRMLNLGRVDLIVDNRENFLSDVIKAGVDPSDYVQVMVVRKDDVSYAFHIETPYQVINKLQKAFDKRSEDGSIDSLFKKYQALRYMNSERSI
jgi:polar amino acid transport system substrate-binding protein